MAIVERDGVGVGGGYGGVCACYEGAADSDLGGKAYYGAGYLRGYEGGYGGVDV